MDSPSFVSFARRRTRRAAAFIEALIVVAFLILGFIGLVFFRELYLKQMHTARLARASLIAYSMTGCRANTNEPAEWLGPRDMGRITSGSPNTNDSPAIPTGQPAQPAAPSQPQSRSGDILGRVGGTTSDGDGVVNPIAITDLSVTISAQTRSGPLQRGHARFEARPRARSFVSCADPVRRSFEDTVDYIAGLFP